MKPTRGNTAPASNLARAITRTGAILIATVLLTGADDPSESPEKSDQLRSQGIWKLTESWDDGKHAKIDAPIAFRFDGGTMEFGRWVDGEFQSEEEPVRFPFTLDENARPKRLNSKAGPRTYILEDDVLYLCGVSKSGERPKTAAKRGTVGDGLWIGVFHRKKTTD